MPKISRYGLYGDFWSRALRWSARNVPAFLEPIMIAFASSCFFAIARKERGALGRNIAVLLPGSSPVANVARALRVFWNFAWSIVDAAHVQDGDRIISWEIVGDHHFQKIQEQPEGILILTAHMGNYDIAAPVFSHKFRRKLHTVRLPEKHASLQAYMEATRDRQQDDRYQIHYNRPGNMLAIELAGALSAGEAVAIQGDRVLGEVATIHAPFETTHDLMLPKGPFILALASRAPVLPLFIIRLGWRNYRVLIRPPHPPPPDPRDRAAALNHHVTRWTQTLGAVARTHWKQWFVLEDAFVPATNAPEKIPSAPLKPDDPVELLPRAGSAPGRSKLIFLSVLSAVVYAAAMFQGLHHFLPASLAALLTYPGIFLGVTLGIICLSLLHALPIVRRMPAQRFHCWAHYGLMAWLLWRWAK